MQAGLDTGYGHVLAQALARIPRIRGALPRPALYPYVDCRVSIHAAASLKPDAFAEQEPRCCGLEVSNPSHAGKTAAAPPTYHPANRAARPSALPKAAMQANRVRAYGG